ncbi:hypothetical protein D1007_13868 [Hordeum vulgare]|nr:hypothetical protein D1007_13868 [Hordeum vulgare]
MARLAGDGQPRPKKASPADQHPRPVLSARGHALEEGFGAGSSRSERGGSDREGRSPEYYAGTSLRLPPPPRDPERDPRLPLPGSPGDVRRREAARLSPPDVDREYALRAELVARPPLAPRSRDEHAPRDVPARPPAPRASAPAWQRDRPDHRPEERRGGPPSRPGAELRRSDWRPSRAEGADWRREDGPSRRTSPVLPPVAPSAAPSMGKKKKKKSKKKRAAGATPATPAGLVISADLIREELAAYIGDFRDSSFAWEVTETAPLVFSVPFPSAELLRVCSHDFIRCPINKFMISVKAAATEPDPVPPLEKVWVLVYGLPRGVSAAPRGGKLTHILKAISEPVGNLITADLASFEDDGPAHIEILCPAPAEIDGLSLVFYFGSKGRRLTFELESPVLVDPLGVDPDDQASPDGGLDDKGGSSEEGFSSEGEEDVGGAQPESSAVGRIPATSAAGPAGHAGCTPVVALVVDTGCPLPVTAIPAVAAEEEVSMGLKETIRQDFSMLELQRLSRHHFAWQWLPATGHSGGILLGVREDTFSMEDMDRGEFFMSMAVTDRRVHLSWEVIIVYGPADQGRWADFLAELKNKVERCTTPVVVAGDFNLIRWASDISSLNVDRPRMRLFNDCIADLALREIARVRARFMWSNKQVDPIRSVLDRVFVSAQWEVMFPLCGLKVITRIGSDHTPLVFSTGDGAPPRSCCFRFETFWQEQPGFCDRVRNRWRLAASSTPRVFYAVDVWHHCAKLAHQAMRGWGANLGADLRARKGALLGQLQELDDLADGPGLSPDDWIRRNSLDTSLMDIYKSEELFWQRRGGQNWLLKGDANTTYFQAIANGRRRKCAIPFLWDGDALLESPEDISSHIYSFYKEMFLAEPLGGISLRVDFWPLVEQVSDAENAELTLPFSPEEVGQAIASMKACSAPGPDGLPVIFFQRFWETVRPAIMPMFQEFFIGTLDIGRLNFGIITLIPKVVGASDIRQFRPIMVINVVAQIFAKFWKSIQGIKHDIRLSLRISVGNGSGTQFWLDPWLDGEPLRMRFPRLFSICGDPAALVAASAREDGWHVAFRRPLGPAEAHEWAALQVVVPLPVSSDRDYVLWSLSPSGHFSVSSAYLALCRTPVIPWLSPLWKAPLPLKNKIFVWQLLRDRLPSGTEVLKRHGPGNGTCPLCHVPENGTHILFSCVAAQALWGFVHEALGPEWEAHDLADFLQHCHPLVRPRDRDRLQGYLALLTSARRLSHRPHGA